MNIDHVILTIYPEATILEKVLEDGSHVSHPISPADLAAQLNQIPLSTGLLPHNTLFWRQVGGEELIAIYVPPRRWRTIAYERRYHLPLPGILFMGTKQAYTVLPSNKSPRSRKLSCIIYPYPTWTATAESV